MSESRSVSYLLRKYDLFKNMTYSKKNIHMLRNMKIYFKKDIKIINWRSPRPGEGRTPRRNGGPGRRPDAPAGWNGGPRGRPVSPCGAERKMVPGPNICIDPHLACRHVKCLLVRARGSWMFVCFLVVCRVFVCVLMLKTCKRESWLGVSRGTPYLFRHCGPGAPLGVWLLAALFLHHFPWCFFVFFFCCFVDGIRPPFWLHVGVIFHVCCITFLSIDLTWICHRLCNEFFPKQVSDCRGSGGQ